MKSGAYPKVDVVHSEVVGIPFCPSEADFETGIGNCAGSVSRVFVAAYQAANLHPNCVWTLFCYLL